MKTYIVKQKNNNQLGCIEYKIKYHNKKDKHPLYDFLWNIIKVDFIIDNQEFMFSITHKKHNHFIQQWNQHFDERIENV